MTPKPTNPTLYARVKAEAKRRFKVWPSAYGSAWLVKTYKKRGGGYTGSISGGGLSEWWIAKRENRAAANPPPITRDRTQRAALA
jgi:hypothetical protein